MEARTDETVPIADLAAFLRSGGAALERSDAYGSAGYYGSGCNIAAGGNGAGPSSTGAHGTPQWVCPDLHT